MMLGLFLACVQPPSTSQPADTTSDWQEPPVTSTGCEDGVAALFTDASGAVTALAEAVDTNGAVVATTLPEPGTLAVCPGEVVLPLVITADIAIIGTDDPADTLLSGGGITTIKVHSPAQSVSVEGVQVVGGEADELSLIHI